MKKDFKPKFTEKDIFELKGYRFESFLRPIKINGINVRLENCRWEDIPEDEEETWCAYRPINNYKGAKWKVVKFVRDPSDKEPNNPDQRRET